MILDKVSNWELYFKTPKFSEIFEESTKINKSIKMVFIHLRIMN